MRIRKRSIAALSLSCEKPEVSCTNRAEERMIKEKEFLLPLVKAAMDVQARPRAHFGEKGGHAIGQIRSHPLHKWKNALLRCTVESQALQENGEDEKSSYRWDGIMRKTGGDKFRLLTSQGGCEKKALLDVGVGAAMKKQRSKSNCTRKCHPNEKWKISPKMKGNEDKADEDKKMVLEENKKVPEDNKNLHAGSQCRRRNGRGWRCSERTLVGYYLCEHHLGKSRLRSINNSAGKVVGNGKGAKFKELKLIHAAAASASASASPM